jgi:tetratricopeptide (TPR) repeat protein
MSMSGEGYRVLLDCRRRSEVLRAKGFTYDQVADIFSAFHDVSPLRLYRYAYGRTAAEVVATFNDLDPTGTASLREGRLYDYETWPVRGKRPSARALTIFAQIYRTAARRLVSDQAYASYIVRDRDLIDRTDHHSHEPRHISVTKARHVTMERAAVRTSGNALSPAPADCAALLRALTAEEADVKRRDLLFELALALGGAPALALLRHLAPSEKERLATAVRTSGRVDAQTVDVIEKLTTRCRHLDDDFGPEAVLPVVDAHRALLTDLLQRETLLPGLRDRLINAYAQFSQLSGYLHHDLTDYAQASRRYQEALTAAHQTTDLSLIAYLHICLSYMAMYQGRTGQAFDHVFAAQGWARRSPSNVLRSVHAMELARVLAREGETQESEHAFAHSVSLADQPRNEADPSYLYWWTPGQVQSCASDCLLAWGRLDASITSAERTLASPTTPKLLRGQTLLQYADTLIRKREVPAAAEKIRDAARLTNAHSSARLVDSVRQARARLQPWAGNKHVRTLDEELQSLGIAAVTKE